VGDEVNMLRSPRAVAIVLNYEASAANLRVIPDVKPLPRRAPRNISTLDATLLDSSLRKLTPSWVGTDVGWGRRGLGTTWSENDVARNGGWSGVAPLLACRSYCA
jgi:hypothetical protein